MKRNHTTTTFQNAIKTNKGRYNKIEYFTNHDNF